MATGLLQNLGATEEENPTTIGQQAQDVAKAQGVAYEDIGKPQPLPDYQGYNADAAKTQMGENVNIQSGSSYIDPDKSTVAGQLQSLLSSDSPYLSENRRQATEKAGERGLLNSSIAAGAGQRAAIQSALPIAQQDAETYAKFGMQEQAAKNQMQTIQGEAIVSGEIVKQQKALEQQNQNIQNQFTALIRGADQQSATWLADLKNTYDTGIQEMNNQQNLLLQREQISAEKNQMVRKETSAVMQNYQITVENLMTDPDFLAMGTTAVNKAINELQALARNSINFIGAASEIDLTEFTDEYLADLAVR
jgi:hypothetical protein